MKPKLILFGTPQIAADIFTELSDVARIVCVVTAPDRPAGRGQKLQPSPVKKWALANNLEVSTELPSSQAMAALNADLGIVIAYGQLFKPDFLATAPPLWNLHYSLLPKYRGASPVQSAIAAGEEVSGVTIFQIAAGMDDGDIVAQTPIPYDWEDNGATLYTKANQAMLNLFKET